MKKKFKVLLPIGIIFFVLILIGLNSDETDISSTAVEGKNNIVSNLKEEETQSSEEKKLEEEKQAEEQKKLEEEKRAEEQKRAQEAEAARIAEEKRLEEERLRKEAEIAEANRIEAERKAAEQQQVQATSNSSFYVTDGTASHDHSTGYDSPYSDPNEPVITEEYGYIASGNNYIHKTPNCKFIRDKGATQVPVSSSGKASCNCWYY